MIGEMRTEALVKALGREGLTSETLIGLLVLALAADNVSIRTHEYAPIQSIAGVIAEGGKLTSDTALIHTTAIKVLQTVLNCRLAYGVGSGLAARIAGEAIGADADMPAHGDRGVPCVPLTRRARGRGQPTPRPSARPRQGYPRGAGRAGSRNPPGPPGRPIRAHRRGKLRLRQEGLPLRHTGTPATRIPPPIMKPAATAVRLRTP